MSSLISRRNVTKAALAASTGAAMVGYEEATAQTVLQESKPIFDYAALRNYTGQASGVRVTKTGIAGFFQKDDTDTASPDNGAMVIVDAIGRRWKRLYEGAAEVSWFPTVQSALDFWRTYNGPLKMVATRGQYTITTPLNCTWTATDSHQKELDMSGAALLFQLSTTGIGLTFFAQSSAAGTYVYNKAIRNIYGQDLNGNCTTMVLIDGGENTGAVTGHFYGSEIQNINLIPHATPAINGNGLIIRNNFYESVVRDVDIRNYLNTTGKMFMLDQQTGSNGVISSLSVDNIKTDGGEYGIYCDEPEDIGWSNLSAIRAQKEGIYIGNHQGNVIRNVHVEANWKSAGAYVAGNAGMRVIMSDTGGVIDGVFAPGKNGWQTHAVNVYMTARATCTIIGGSHGSGLQGEGAYAYMAGQAGAGAVIIGRNTYVSDGNVKVTQSNGNSISTQTVSATSQAILNRLRINENFINYTSNVVPNLANGGFVRVGTLIGNVTIENPIGGASTGDQFVLEVTQDATGGKTVSFGSNFALTPSAVGSGAYLTSRWVFIHSNAKWRQLSFSTSY